MIFVKRKLRNTVRMEIFIKKNCLSCPQTIKSSSLTIRYIGVYPNDLEICSAACASFAPHPEQQVAFGCHSVLHLGQYTGTRSAFVSSFISSPPLLSYTSTYCREKAFPWLALVSCLLYPRFRM